MSSFTVEDFTVTISQFRGGFAYSAFDGKRRIVDPHRVDGAYSFASESEAKAAAERTIFFYKVSTMLFKLSEAEQAFIALCIRRIYDGELVVVPDFQIDEDLMKVAESRRRR